MKYLLIVMIAITFVANIAIADYNVKSEFLKHPKKNIDLVVDTADFWLSARDNVNSGFYNYVDNEGNPTLPNEPWWGSQQCGGGK